MEHERAPTEHLDRNHGFLNASGFASVGGEEPSSPWRRHYGCRPSFPPPPPPRGAPSLPALQPDGALPSATPPPLGDFNFLHLVHGFPRRVPSTVRMDFASRDAKIQAPEDQSEIIFIGTGTSEGIPRVSCLTNQSKACKVCSKAIEPGNKNRRLNTSILIRYVNSVGRFNILVDAGKFFYHSALRWFPAYGLRNIDAVIITHSHADAIGGLDDLRDWTNNVQPFIPIYVAQRDFEVMKKTHYYIVDTSVIVPGAAVSELQFNVINEEPFVIHDLKVTPLPVWHGHGYRSLGFRFGDICYISDVSDIPEETYMLLKDCDLLILDALRPDRSSSTHFGLPRALEEVRKIQPRRTLFTGMMHLMDHDEINEELAKLLESEGLDVQLSYDGLRVPVNL
ncbi:putative hydrolase C777.06c isoform X3 [Musa acuminata AAA Group]|uniref:putative hydrolase C777.06c isoform X3 n=1 Tax=Musa acuminata AAA Group TaxID=214697 RepID=UPI0031D9A972